jgi:hypothetical protein
MEPYLLRQIDRDPPRNVITALAFDLGIRDLDRLAMLGCTTVLGGMHSLILDDLVDNAGGSSSRPWHHLYLAHVLYVLHHDELQRIHPETWLVDGGPAALIAQIRTYRALVDEELNHVGQAKPYESLANVWDKCAPVVAVIERVLALAGAQDLLPALTRANDLTCLALCLLDDLLDWEQDISLGRITYPIQLALDQLHPGDSHCPTDERIKEVGIELYFGVTYHRVLRLVMQSLREALELVGPGLPNLASFLQASIDRGYLTWTRHVSFLQETESRLSQEIEEP